MIARVFLLAACMLCMMLAAFVWRLAYTFRPRSERDTAMSVNLWLFFVACLFAAAFFCWRVFA